MNSKSQSCEVKFRVATPEKPLIIVPVKVNEQGPFDFVLDTGASATIVSTKLAKDLKLSEELIGEGMSAGGRISESMTRLESFAIGTATIKDLIAGITDLDELSQVLELKLDGIIGYNFLYCFRVTIDYLNSFLRLESS